MHSQLSADKTKFVNIVRMRQYYEVIRVNTWAMLEINAQYRQCSDSARTILAIIEHSEGPSVNHCSPAFVSHQPISIASHTLERAHKSHRIVETDQYYVRELANDQRANRIHNILGVVVVCMFRFLSFGYLFVFHLPLETSRCTRAPSTNSYVLGVSCGT